LVSQVNAVEYKECSTNGRYDGRYKAKTPQEHMSKLPTTMLVPGFYNGSGYKYFYTYTSPIYSKTDGLIDSYTFKTTIKICFFIAGKEVHCGAPFDIEGGLKCEKAPIPQAQLSFTPAPGQTEPRPKGSEGADGKSTYDLVAKVIEGAKPKAGMAVTFEVTVEAGSGGLPKTPAGRPPGDLSIKSGITDAKGELKVSFTAPIFAGTHTVKVKCAKCSKDKEKEFKFNVKVPGLSLFSADTKVPARWKFVGTDNYHKQERFYLTKVAADNLRSLIDAIQLIKSDKTKKPWGVVELNDSSLPWGGKYNGYNSDAPQPYHWETTWNRDRFHAGHRLGVEIDIRTSDKLRSDKAHVTKAYNEICKDKNVTATILNHYGINPHFHAYLLGNVSSKLGGSACWQSAN
jgi:hypothetical protein